MNLDQKIIDTFDAFMTERQRNGLPLHAVQFIVAASFCVVNFMAQQTPISIFLSGLGLAMFSVLYWHASGYQESEFKRRRENAFSLVWRQSIWRFVTMGSMVLPEPSLTVWLINLILWMLYVYLRCCLFIAPDRRVPVRKVAYNMG